MKRVIITGATGFVGTNLTLRLLKDGHEIHLVVRPGYNSWRIQAIRADVHLHEVSFVDIEGLQRVVGNIRPDWIFHLAVYGAYASQTDVGRMAQTNIIGTINLVRACLEAGFEAFVNTGSSSEYGFKQGSPSELECLEPNSYYAVTKASATLFCRYVAQSENVHIPTLRLYSVYGPYEEPKRLMPTLILEGLQGRLPSLVDPDTAHDYVYVDDVNQAYLLAAGQPGQERGVIYNVGSGLQTSIREVVEVARRALAIKAEPEWGSMPNRPWDTKVWAADNRKVQDKLGWQPKHSFEEGFRKMMNWFIHNPKLLDFYRKAKA